MYQLQLIVAICPSIKPVLLIFRCPTTQKRRFVSGGCDNLVKIWSYDDAESRWVEVNKLGCCKIVIPVRPDWAIL